MSKKERTIQRQYHLFDADGKVLGRMATEIATILRGKHKVDFTPNIDRGDFVVLINSDKVAVTGNKKDNKMYHSFSGYPGGVTSITLRNQLKKDSTKVFRNAVYGMLCKNKLRDKMIKRLLIYKGPEHAHTIDIKH